MTLPEIPDDDSDFTPELARKIVAKYQAIIGMRNSDNAALEDALQTSTTMLEALLVQLNSWGHESACNARGQILRNEELLNPVGQTGSPL